MGRKTKWVVAAAATLPMAAGLGMRDAAAYNFTFGQLQGAFDTDLTYGLSFRTQTPSPTNQGAYGNRHLFDERWDIFSNLIKGSHTLELTGSDYGAVLRGNWFYDFEMANQPLPDAAENRAKSHGDITDAYVYKYFGDVSVRAGKQVISWGENTFISGAMADINTVDITKLRTPGSDLKDAFVGTPAIDIAWNFGENYTLEGFYLFGFDEVKVDPMGSFFTTLDAIADGGGFANTPAGCIAPDGGRCDLLGGGLVRTGDDIPSYSGQWGLAFRVFLPNFGNGGELGLYYQNLHDHLPMLSGYSGTGLFFVDYPEDIERWGVSFNTNYRGIAWSGEYSYRRNAPIQLTLPLLLTAGGPPTGEKLEGFDRIERHQAQVTMNKNWGVTQWLGADANTTLAELMWGWIGGRPSDTVVGPGLPNLLEPDISEDFGKLVVRQAFTYNAALFNLIALEPSVAFSWDLHGYSNELGGAKLVVDDRKALTLGLGFLYGGGQWTGGINYTRFFGPDGDFNATGGRYNGTNDRDFVSLNVSYSF